MRNIPQRSCLLPVLLLCMIASCKESMPVEPVPIAFEPVRTGGILFTKRISGTAWAIDWMDADGGGRRSVLDAGYSLAGRPQAGHVPVAKRDTSGSNDAVDSMFVLDLLTGSKTFITTQTWGLYSSMELSSDGENVLLWSEQDAETGRAAVRVSSSNGSLTSLLVESGVWSPPAFSPDGRSIAYVQSRYSTEHDDLFVISVDGTDNRAVDTNVALGGLSWSPTGRQIAYEKSGMWIADIENGVRGRISPQNETDFDASWSPSGLSIICVSGNPMVSTRIVVMNSDGTSRRDMTNVGGMIDYLPTWSPTGDRFLYLTQPRNGDRLYSELRVMDIATATSTTLVSDADGLAYWY